MSITCSERVFIALVVHHATRMRRIFICDLSGCTIFFLSHKWHDFQGGGGTGRQTCFEFLDNFLYETFLILRKFRGVTIMNILGFHVNCPLEHSLLIFEKYWDKKFYVSRSSESRVVPCGRTDRIP